MNFPIVGGGELQMVRKAFLKASFDMLYVVDLKKQLSEQLKATGFFCFSVQESS